MGRFSRFCAWIIGLVLLAAGLLKLMDPVGAGLVMAEYFKFLKVPFLIPASEALGVVSAFFEAVLGIAVVCGVWRRVVAVVCGAVLLLFTGITFLLWLKNPAMDCGCFGEIVHLTHARSLLKNLALDLLWVVAYVPFSRLGGAGAVKYVGFGLSCATTLVFAVWSQFTLPAVDFTSMSPGVELAGAFGLDRAEEDAPVLSFCDSASVYADSLALSGKVMVVSIYSPDKFGAPDWQKAATIAKGARAAGFTPLVIVSAASLPGSVADEDIYYGDRRMLMTLNRSNGGVTYICDGQIICKWTFRSAPDAVLMRQIYNEDVTDFMARDRTVFEIGIQLVFLFVLALLLLL